MDQYQDFDWQLCRAWTRCTLASHQARVDGDGAETILLLPIGVCGVTSVGGVGHFRSRSHAARSMQRCFGSTLMHRTWASLGRPWVSLGQLGPAWASLGQLGPAWAGPGPAWAGLGRLGPALGQLGPALGRLGPAWASLGRPWAGLGPARGGLSTPMYDTILKYSIVPAAGAAGLNDETNRDRPRLGRRGRHGRRSWRRRLHVSHGQIASPLFPSLNVPWFRVFRFSVYKIRTQF